MEPPGKHRVTNEVKIVFFCVIPVQGLDNFLFLTHLVLI